MKKKFSLLLVVSVLSLALFWTPFLLRSRGFWGIEFGNHNNMQTIVQNFDGLNFLVVAKSWYKPDLIEKINSYFLTGNYPLYFTAHYPGLPIVISFFDHWMTGPQAVLASIVLSNILLVIGLFCFYKIYAKDKKMIAWLTGIALFFPARILADRVVGSNEPLFITAVLISLYFAKKKQYWWSALAGSLAIITRSPGILLFGGYCLAWMSQWSKNNHKVLVKTKEVLPYLLMPVTLLSVWAFYGYQNHNLWAYFQSGVSMNIKFPPFAIFGTNQKWISGMWREEVIYIYLFFAMGLVAWGKRVKREFEFGNLATIMYASIYLISIMFVAHRDVSRYALPIAPIVILGLEKYLNDRWVKRVLWVLIIPVYLFSWQFVLQNIQPVANWSGLL